jgi:hypothetical protein
MAASVLVARSETALKSSDIRTYNAQVVRSLRLIITPPTYRFAWLDVQGVCPALRPRRVAMIVLSARHDWSPRACDELVDESGPCWWEDTLARRSD